MEKRGRQRSHLQHTIPKRREPIIHPWLQRTPGLRLADARAQRRWEQDERTRGWPRARLGRRRRGARSTAGSTARRPRSSRPASGARGPSAPACRHQARRESTRDCSRTARARSARG
eukprot:6209487-Pleurochrysis_carterae.AAC.1